MTTPKMLDPMFDRVTRFYEKFGWRPGRVRPISSAEKYFRLHCMKEELEEYRKAETDAKMLDSLVDLVVFALGTAVVQGYEQFATAFSRVMDANEQKTPGQTGRVRFEWERDLRKPPGWRAPDLRDLVGEEVPVTGGLAETASLTDGPRDPCWGRPHRSEQRRADDAATHEAFHAAGCGDCDPPCDKMRVVRSDEGHPDEDPRLRRLQSLMNELYEDGACPATFFGYTIDDIEAMRSELEEARRELATIHPAHRAASDLIRKKSADYASLESDSKSQYHPFGHKSYVQMIHTKYLRLRSVSELAEQNRDPNFEPLEGTILDMINYLAFYWAWVAEERKNGGSQEES